MPTPLLLREHLSLPAIVAPMFLASGPDLVVETCRNGLLGTFPALNLRTTEDFAGWMEEIEERLTPHRHAAPFGVNLIVHRSNTRLAADLRQIEAHHVPVVITSLGAVREVVETVHGYGGLVLHDVISRRHAEKAVSAGVDGIVAVCAGAGGHAGLLSPFALVPEIRQVFDGMIALAGALSTGAHIAAAQLIGADLAYIGTRFLATQETMIAAGHKAMILDSRAEHIVHTAAVSGVPANFLGPSLSAAGIDPAHPPSPGGLDVGSEAKAWRDVWSAGQGVGSIGDLPTAGDLCRRLHAEYVAARASLGATEAIMSGPECPDRASAAYLPAM